MEGVEDSPGSALSEGMSWNWESFPEYLDALEEMPRAVDVATHVPHGAVRAYVMGDRGAANEDPTESDIARMANIVEEGSERGPWGFYLTNSATQINRRRTGTWNNGDAGRADRYRSGHGARGSRCVRNGKRSDS